MITRASLTDQRLCCQEFQWGAHIIRLTSSEMRTL
jgi:hypothetical protein